MYRETITKKVKMSKKRIADSDDSNDSNDSEDAVETQEETKNVKTIDERDLLVEGFTKLMWDVQNKTSSLKPIYEGAIRQMFETHCVESDVSTIEAFIKQYLDLIDTNTLMKGFSSAINNNRLVTAQYLHKMYKFEPIEFANVHHLFEWLLLSQGHFEMAKFVYSIAKPNQIKLDAVMLTCMDKPHILSILCELNGGSLEVYHMTDLNIFEHLPATLRKLTVYQISGKDLPDLSHLTQVTSLDLSNWNGRQSLSLSLPSSLQELTLKWNYNQPLDLSHCTSLVKLTVGHSFNSPLKVPDSLRRIISHTGSSYYLSVIQDNVTVSNVI
jgi:hypothetical protein